jgi:hypothetical protein
VSIFYLLYGLTEKSLRYRNTPALFSQLAAQSAALSMSDASLFDHPFYHKTPTPIVASGGSLTEDLITFTKLDEHEVKQGTEQLKAWMGVLK